jgi:hypothetical protein
MSTEDLMKDVYAALARAEHALAVERQTRIDADSAYKVMLSRAEKAEHELAQMRTPLDKRLPSCSDCEAASDTDGCYVPCVRHGGPEHGLSYIGMGEWDDTWEHWRERARRAKDDVGQLREALEAVKAQCSAGYYADPRYVYSIADEALHGRPLPPGAIKSQQPRCGFVAMGAQCTLKDGHDGSHDTLLADVKPQMCYECSKLLKAGARDLCDECFSKRQQSTCATCGMHLGPRNCTTCALGATCSHQDCPSCDDDGLVTCWRKP